MICVECDKEVGDGLACPACGAVQTPRAGADRFALLGVAPRFDVDERELDARYRELSRKLHPDRFARAPAKARMRSLQAATALNDAYRTLRDPIKRAEY